MTAPLASHTVLLAAAAPTAWGGKIAFAAVFVLLALILASLPPHLAGKADPSTPWWRRVRVWAVLIALAQVAIYAYWG